MPQKSVTVYKPVDEFGGDSVELKRLRATHAVYQIYMSHWNLCMSAYEGGPEFANEMNIFRHFRENEDDFRDRTRRLHYINYCEQLVDFYTNFIFSETIDRDPGDNAAWFNQFILDVDRCGTSLEEYMRRVSDESQIYGLVYTFIDAPPLPEGVDTVSKQDEADLKMRPYWVLMRPDEILDWTLDDFENFTYVKRREIISRPDPSGKIDVFERYTEMFQDHFQVTLVNITDATHPKVFAPITTPNDLGYIPVFVHRYKRSKRYPFMGNSFLRDFAYNNREIMNITSLLQEFLYRQCFNVLVKEIESSIPITSQQDGILGTANVLEIPKDAEFPRYLSPPADPAKFLQGERENIKNEMFARASQDAMTQMFNGQGASGFSKSQSFSKTVPFIAARAENLERAENVLFKMTLERINKDWDGRIKYKDHYEITNLTDAMTQFVMITRDMFMPSETFDKAELKRFVKEFDGKLAPEVMAKVVSEIDSMDYDAWKLVQQEALVKPAGNGGTSPAEQQAPKGSGTTAEVAAESNNQGSKATKKVKSK